MATPERFHELAPLVVMLVDLKHIAAASRAGRVARDLAHVLAQSHLEATSSGRLFDRGLDACNRLHSHLYECTRALDSSPMASAARVRAFRVARTLTDTVLDRHFAQREQTDSDLTRALATVRTRFLMARKADAISALAERMGRISETGRTRLVAGLDAVRQVADVELVAFEQSIASHVRASIVGHARRLFEQWSAFVRDLGEALPPRPMTLDLSLSVPSAPPAARITSERQVTLRLAVASRLSIDDALRDAMLRALEERSSELVAHARETYSLLDSELERSFSAAVDEIVEGAEASESLLRDAIAHGEENLMWVRRRAARWQYSLQRIAHALRAGNRLTFVDDL